MDPALATIVVAVITTIGGLVGLSIKEFRGMRKSNDKDHGDVMQKLDNVQTGVDKVADRLDDHIDWHLKK
jgi:hypothetical protein